MTRLLLTGVAVEKLASGKFAKNAMRQDALTKNDFLGSPRHFLSPEFALIFGNPSFSTVTGDYTHNPVNEGNGDVSPVMRPESDC